MEHKANKKVEYKVKKYVFTPKDRKEIKSLLIFLSGVLGNAPIKNIEFTKSKLNDHITIQRWDDESKNQYSEITETIKK